MKIWAAVGGTPSYVTAAPWVEYVATPARGGRTGHPSVPPTALDWCYQIQRPPAITAVRLCHPASRFVRPSSEKLGGLTNRLMAKAISCRQPSRFRGRGRCWSLRWSCPYQCWCPR